MILLGQCCWTRSHWVWLLSRSAGLGYPVPWKFWKVSGTEAIGKNKAVVEKSIAFFVVCTCRWMGFLSGTHHMSLCAKTTIAAIVVTSKNRTSGSVRGCSVCCWWWAAGVYGYTKQFMLMAWGWQHVEDRWSGHKDSKTDRTMMLSAILFMNCCFVLFYFICLLICFILNTWFFLLLICKLLFISPGCCTSCFACWLLKLLLSNLLHDHKLPCSNVSYFLWAAHMKWMLNHTIKNPKHWSLNRSRTLMHDTIQLLNPETADDLALVTSSWTLCTFDIRMNTMWCFSKNEFKNLNMTRKNLINLVIIHYRYPKATFDFKLR